ncbi:hypothetical protein DSCW_08910 [Desulfosarcina widdelii]|uniref:Uncharacterized protein n=1 Tax=Desulfosarcina widdelii TaxID=947919 RepID=A0A5K7Z4U1_9BACT|nr:hypothetical protein [Desulfosarcina widdelii]BBO73474.1 hypothetical protein DSCW_08910 [Desulfosarcina widdelii]
MHFVISWDISAQGDDWTRLNDQMREMLNPYSWARPLSTFYIVQVESQEAWDLILKQMGEFTQGAPYNINFLMSPLMSGGRYNGILPKEMWEEINKRSE